MFVLTNINLLKKLPPPCIMYIMTLRYQFYYKQFIEHFPFVFLYQTKFLPAMKIILIFRKELLTDK